jgi:hypothetical protein
LRLNWRFAVKGIHRASRLLGSTGIAADDIVNTPFRHVELKYSV